MSKPLQVVEVPQNSTGSILEYTFVTDGVADDLSSATGEKYFYCNTIDGTALASEVDSSWTTDGSDGKVEVTLTSVVVNTVRDVYCQFKIEGYNGGAIVTRKFILRITDSLIV